MNRFFFLFLCFLSVQFLRSQVTVGTKETSVPAALLQLKNINNVTNGDANATKGMMLPRVNITDPKSLVDINGASTSSPEAYTGLMVYNVHTQDPCDSYLYPTGVALWTGTEWEMLGGEVTVNPNDDANAYKQDLIALKKIADANPEAAAARFWTFTGMDTDNPSFSGAGVTTRATACGKRIVELYLVPDNIHWWTTEYGIYDATTLKKFTTLDLTGLDALEILSVGYQQLDKIDLTQCPNLKEFRDNSLYMTNQTTPTDNTSSQTYTVIDWSNCKQLEVFLITGGGPNVKTFVDTQLPSTMRNFGYMQGKIDPNNEFDFSLCKKNIVQAQLGETDYAGSIVDLSDCPLLMYVHFAYTKVKKIYLRNSTALEQVNLNNSTMSGELTIVDYPNLRFVYADNTQLDGKVIIQNCPKLTNVTLLRTKITQFDLSGCPIIRELKVASDSIRSGTIIANNNKSLTDVVLNLGNFNKIDLSNTAIKTLQTNSTILEELNVSGCTSLLVLNVVTDNMATPTRAMKVDATGCTNLNTLTLSNIYMDPTNVKIAGCTTLKTFYVKNCEYTSPLDFTGYKSLTTFGNTNAVTPPVDGSISICSSTLSNLSLTGDSSLTTSAFTSVTCP